MFTKNSSFFGRWYKLSALALAFFISLQPLGVVFAEDVIDLTQAENVSEQTLNQENEIINEVAQNTDQSIPQDIIQNTQTEKTSVNELSSSPNLEPTAIPEMNTSNLSGPTNVPEPVTGYVDRFSKLPKVDDSSGALIQNIEIQSPLGRNGLQPNLSIAYNSQDKTDQDIFGYGWKTNIPYIERLSKKGVDHLFSENFFVSSLDGELATTALSSVFVARSENGNFNKYVFSSNQWLMSAKNGWQYKFGYATSTQLSDPQNPDNISRWMLEEIRDMNGNYIKYEYFKDSGQIYPSRIVYTGSGQQDGIFEISFLRESRTDVVPSYRTGFLVQSKYRINEIQVKTNGSWVRKYSFSYISGDNGWRSLLSAVIEYGKDELGNVIQLPPTEFKYQKGTFSWTLNQQNYTASFSLAADQAYQYEIQDLNGDTRPDVFHGISGVFFTNHTTWFYNPAQKNWLEAPSSTIPIDFKVGEDRNNFITNWDRGVRAADLNGDLYPDILKAEDGANGGFTSYINNKGLGWMQNNNFSASIGLGKSKDSTEGSFQEYGGYVLDLNGDGLADIIRQKTGHYLGAQLNNGYGYNSATSTWNTPVGLRYNNDGSVFSDVNNDGLPDLQSTYYTNSGNDYHSDTYLNTGSGSWVANEAVFSDPAHRLINNSGYSETEGMRFLDLNGDGLLDAARDCCGGGQELYFNKGSGWYQKPYSWVLPAGTVSPGKDTDINGDGLVDFLYEFNKGSAQYYAWIYFHDGVVPDLLSTVIYPEGGRTSVSYKKSSELADSSGNLLNPNLPLQIDLVTAIQNFDGVSTSSPESYIYKGGLHYYNNPFDKKFAGFSEIDKTDAEGNVTKTFYHQGDGTDVSHGEFEDNFWKIGKPYRVEQYDNSGNLYKKTINKWESATSSQNSLAGFVKLGQTLQQDYDGTSNHKDKAESYTYNNSTGDITQKVEYGEVTGSDNGTFSDSGTDDFTTTFSYATSSTSSALSLLSGSLTTDHNSSKVKEVRNYYDSLPLGSADKGNLTKQESWKSGSSYVSSQKTYNSYGLVTSQTDPRGKVTSFSYDSYNLYPTTVTNPLSQVTLLEYDYSSGQVATSTDPNGNIFVNVYDGLDRLVSQKHPDPANPSVLNLKSSISYTDTQGAFSVKQTKYLSSSLAVDSYTYLDGLSRPKQIREMAESGNFAVKDFSYNSRGLLSRETLPYFSSGSATTTATSTGSLYLNYSYDALGRLAVSGSSIATTTNSYVNWKQTTINPNGKNKDLYSDAFGNLSRVDEHNSTSTYSTYYTYDYNKNLTKITDALGNVRNFAYDGLSRRVSAEDLHQSSDATFGSYAFVYDDSGNLTQKTDPKSQVTNYSYDDLNRVLTEDFTGQAGTEVQYSYDSCANGKGHMCNASSTGYSLTNSYNALGQLTSETKLISSNSFSTSYSYDRQGNVITIQNPDNSQVKYIYGSGGKIDQVQRKESADSSFINVVTNMDYAPSGQQTLVAYANGVSTVNNYDPAKLYRLTKKTTTLPTTVKAQDISYFYDAVGNITSILNASASNASSTVSYVYDDLNRLTSASATGTPFGISGFSQTYSYDALGNIINKSDLGAYSYLGNLNSNFANPHAATGISGTSNYSLAYDQNGNLLSLSSVASSTGWTLSGGTWNRRKQITIDHTKVSGSSSLTNFPLLFSTTDAELKTLANGGYVGKSDGTDIVFTSSDGQTKLDYELEKYSSTTGETLAWVKIPTLSTSTDTTLYVYYGNSSASDQQNKTGVWDSNFKAVYHLPNGSSLSASDSTSNANNGSVTGATAGTGQIDGAASFSGSNQYISNSSTLPSGTFTYESWVKPSGTTGYRPMFGSSGYGIEFRINSSNNQIQLLDQGVTGILTSTGSASANTWTHIALTRDGASNAVKIYINGQLDSSTTNAQNPAGSNRLGAATSVGEYFAGSLDEMRASNSVRSADWIKTEYNNQSSASTFYSLGAGDSGSTGGGSGGGSGGGNPPSDWYPPAGGPGGVWTNRKSVTVDKTKVSNSVSNFPVLVSVTDANLKSIANGGLVGKSDGSDILFTSSDGLTKLSHEIEKYSASTGELLAWVKVTSLTSSVNTGLYMYFGNASASDQQNKTGVWDSNFKAVYHLPNGSTLSALDSTSNSNNGSITGATAGTGQIDGAGSFSGSSQYISSSSTLPSGTFTYESWVKPSGTTGYRAIFGGSSYAAELRVNASTNQIQLLDQGITGIFTSTGSASANTWTHIALTRDGSNNAYKLYINGQLDTSTTNSQNPPGSNRLGGAISVGEYFAGSLDEMRASNSVRNADWITTQYNNQSNPNTFMSFGGLESLGSGSSSSSGLLNSNYTWDYNNRMLSAVIPVQTGILATSTSNYLYDPFGQRIKMSVATGTTVTTYYPTKSYNINGSIPTKHIFAGDMLLATLTGTGTSTTVSYIHPDHLGGSNVVTNNSGSVVELTDYYPYGSSRLDERSGSFNEQRKFTGHEYDASTGLNYMNARYQHPTIGRFVSQDPPFWDFSRLGIQLVDPQSWNSYAYARNNPLKYNDPDGQFLDTVIDAGFTAWDGSSFIQHTGNWLGDQALIGIGKLTGNTRIENNGRAGLVQSGTALKSASVDLGIDVGATLIPGVPAFVGRIDDVAKLANKADNVAKTFNAVEQQQKMLKGIENEKAINTIKDVFRKSDEVPGGTMGAIRNEILTGNSTKGIFHGNKAENTINRIQNVFKSEKLNSVETSRLQSISNSLKSLVKNLNR